MSLMRPVVAAARDGSGGDAIVGATVAGRREARATLAIVDAQYRRALARAVATESGERAGAFAEARRLLQAAVALRRAMGSEDRGVSDARASRVRATQPQPSGHEGNLVSR